MNPKTKKVLIISGLAVDVIVTILLFVFSIILLVNMPATKYDVQDPSTFIGWFEAEPIRILLIVVLPLAALLVLNIILTVLYIKKTGDGGKKKEVTINDLTEEQKAALKQKILQEMMQNTEEKK